MRAAVLALLGACSFNPGQYAAPGAGGDVDPLIDASPIAIDAMLDAAPDAMVDAMPDAMPDAPPIVAVATDHASVADTFIAAASPSANYNGQTSALVDGSGNDCVMLIRFDLTSIATNAVVTAAALHIWTDYDPGAAVTLYPLLESWSEVNSSWTDRSPGVYWTTAGAAPPSRGTTAIGSVSPSAAYTGYVITLSAATVAGWVANPATNHGIALVTTNSDGTRFATRENTTTTVRPFLRVTHAP